jgi:hypothetical protein
MRRSDARVAFLSDGRTIASGPRPSLLERAGSPTLEEAFLALRDSVIEP